MADARRTNGDRADIFESLGTDELGERTNERARIVPRRIRVQA